MAFFEFNIAMSGLFAAQRGLQVTSNNITNANTVGYSRQILSQKASKSAPNFETTPHFLASLPSNISVRKSIIADITPATGNPDKNKKLTTGPNKALEKVSKLGICL